MVIAKGKPVHARRFKKRQAELEIDRARLQISNVRGNRAAFRLGCASTAFRDF